MPTAELLAPRRDPRRRGLRVPRGLRRRRASTAPSGAASRARGSGSARSKARTKTPLALALRGRFLVGSRPVGGDFVRRFVASAAESGIDVFRLHDPLNDVSNLREAAEAIARRRARVRRRPRLQPGHDRRDERSSSGRDGCRSSAPRRVLAPRPVRLAGAAPGARARRARSREASGLPVGLYCQGAGGQRARAALEAARAGADLIACARLSRSRSRSTASPARRSPRR